MRFRWEPALALAPAVTPALALAPTLKAAPALLLMPPLTGPTLDIELNSGSGDGASAKGSALIASGPLRALCASLNCLVA